MKKDKGKNPMSIVTPKTQEILNKLKKNLISMKQLQVELDAGNIDYLDLLPLISGGVKINDKYIKLVIDDYHKKIEPKSAKKILSPKSSKPKPSSSKNEPMISVFKKLSVSNKPNKKAKILPELSSLLESIKISKPKQNTLDKINKLYTKTRPKLDLDYIPEKKYKMRPQWMIEQKNKKAYIRPTIERRSSIGDTIEDEMIRRGLKRGSKIIYLEEPPVLNKSVKRKRSSTSSSGSSSSGSSVFSKSSKGSVKSSKSFDYEPQED